MLVAGGSDKDASPLAGAQTYDAASDRWNTTGAMRVGRRGHSMTRLPDGRVLVAGGASEPLPFPVSGMRSSELYDPTTSTWALTGDMHHARCGHSATLLPDGKVLVAGGIAARSRRSARSLSSAEVYDPATGTWTATGEMTDARAFHPAVLLADGRVLVCGGTLVVGPGIYAGLSFCELYDPHAGVWNPAGSMATVRELHDAVLLGDGTALVMGGVAGRQPEGTRQTLRSAERYDPASGGWKGVQDMSARRAGHRAVVLPSGSVLVAGGAGPEWSSRRHPPLAGTEIYDAEAEAWAPAGSMTAGRYWFAAVVLANGHVLAAGGIAASDAGTTVSNAAEVFTP